MAEVKPIQAVRYDPEVAGPLDTLIAPPYDVIDPEQRAELVARNARNVVAVDLPEDPEGGDRYQHAARTMHRWLKDGTVIREDEPAFWVLAQDYTAPDGSRRHRRGFFARVRVEDYGAGRIRPHERTHPGPKEDRLRLTRSTQANLSPIFSLYPDGEGRAGAVLDRAVEASEPLVSVDDHEGTTNALWPIVDRDEIAELTEALAEAELLIADGHHRYETARVYADEIGGEGDHRYVLMLLVALEDPGLLIFPTHRLLTALDGQTDKQQAIRSTLMENFELEPIEAGALEPTEADGRVRMGYMDSFHKQAYALALKDPAIAADALPEASEAYRHLDTAVLEALVLKGALAMSEDDISHLEGLAYSKSFADARDAVENGRADAAFFMRATPVEQVREVAAAGESMPPKSTFFFPKVPTGLLFNPLR